MQINQSTAYIDFEFNGVNKNPLNLVCCSVLPKGADRAFNFWLDKDPKARNELVTYLSTFKTFIAYNAASEARSFLALGLEPTKFEWVDLFLEYRCLSNNNDKLNYGKQLVKGVVKNVTKPRKPWELEEGESNETGFKPTHSLAEASYKLLGQIRDTAHKDAIRDLIISAPDSYSESEKESILNYCAEDVEHLPALYEKMQAFYLELDPGTDATTLHKEMLLRGKYAALTAHMENRGYPLDVKKAKAFSSHVESILFDVQKEINGLFPEVKPFKFDKKTSRFRWDQKITREYIKSLPVSKRWDRTDTKMYSLSLEAFQKFFNFTHDYPTDSLGAQFVRFLKLKQSLYGFVPSAGKKKRTFWDYVGEDGRVRPYFNIYGAQSSRSQPAATGFMMLKPAWMRALVQPSPGMALASIDYGSQEFLISALLADDQDMIESYLSGDVYLAFAKITGMVPQNATKESHKKERNLSKSLVLGMSYKMTKYGLAIKLSQDTGRVWTEDEAQEQIEQFYNAYPRLAKYQEETLKEYQENGFLKLGCGWYAWGDNDNHRSVNNLPIQGAASSIMRKAVEFAFDRGLYVCMTLHDALYIEYSVGQEHQIKILAECMREAFAYYFDDKDTARKIKLDPFAWSPDYKTDSELDIDGFKVECSDLYVDARSINDYQKFSKYFELGAESEL